MTEPDQSTVPATPSSPQPDPFPEHQPEHGLASEEPSMSPAADAPGAPPEADAAKPAEAAGLTPEDEPADGEDPALPVEVSEGSSDEVTRRAPLADPTDAAVPVSSAGAVQSADGGDPALVGDGDDASMLPGLEEAGEQLGDDAMRRALEAILMVTDEPLPVLALSRAVGRSGEDVAEALGGLAAEYTEQGRGFDLREVGGGWRYYTRPEQAVYVERFVLDGQQARLTQAALETLAVVAYKQPVSRARVSAIRGVNVDGVMRTLIGRGLVEEAGADTESQATLYRTSSYFLERMGLQSLDDLPELAPYLPEMDDVEEELAAQNAGPTDGTDGSDGTDGATPDDGTDAAASNESTDAAVPDTSSDRAAPEEGSMADGTESGIDGDLGTGNEPELEVGHEEQELAPAEELEAGAMTDPAWEEGFGPEELLSPEKAPGSEEDLGSEEAPGSAEDLGSEEGLRPEGNPSAEDELAGEDPEDYLSGDEELAPGEELAAAGDPAVEGDLALGEDLATAEDGREGPGPRHG